MIRSYSIIRSFRTLSILLKAVAPLGQTFDIAARVSGNVVFAEYFKGISKRCIAGISLDEAFYAERHPLGELGVDVAEQMSIAKTTGNPSEVLNEITANLEDELTVKLDVLPTVVNFVMLLIFAPIVIILSLAVLEPTLQMAQDTLNAK